MDRQAASESVLGASSEATVGKARLQNSKTPWLYARLIADLDSAKMATSISHTP